MDGGAWWASVHGVAKSWTRLSDFILTHTTFIKQFLGTKHCSNDCYLIEQIMDSSHNNVRCSKLKSSLEDLRIPQKRINIIISHIQKWKFQRKYKYRKQRYVRCWWQGKKCNPNILMKPSFFSSCNISPAPLHDKNTCSLFSFFFTLDSFPLTTVY